MHILGVLGGCCDVLAGLQGLLLFGGLGDFLSKQRGVSGVCECVAGVQASANGIHLMRLHLVGLPLNPKADFSGGGDVGRTQALPSDS